MYTPAPIPAAAVDLNFYRSSAAAALAASQITVTRAQTVNTTDLLPTSPVGYAYQTFAANTPRITPLLGLLSEGSRTNALINSTAPATQTVAVAVGNDTLWVNGAGSATISPGTATGCAGTATQGNPVTVAISAAGTCVVTVTGSLNAIQLEAGTFGTSLIVTAAAPAVRNFDNIVVTSPPAIGNAFSEYVHANFNVADGVGANQASISVDDGVSPHAQLFRFITNSALATTGTNGVASQGSGMQLHQNVPGKHAATVATNLQTSTQDGANPGFSVAAYTPPTGLIVTRMGGNVTGNAQACFCYIMALKVWPTTALTMSQLQQVTR